MTETTPYLMGQSEEPEMSVAQEALEAWQRDWDENPEAWTNPTETPYGVTLMERYDETFLEEETLLEALPRLSGFKNLNPEFRDRIKAKLMRMMQLHDPTLPSPLLMREFFPMSSLAQAQTLVKLDQVIHEVFTWMQENSMTPTPGTTTCPTTLSSRYRQVLRDAKGNQGTGKDNA